MSRIQPKEYPGKEYQPLFDYMSLAYDADCTIDEMNQIIEIVHKHFPNPIIDNNEQETSKKDPS
jgi:hypothetical protein